MIRILHRAVKVLHLIIQYPSYRAVIDRHSDHGPHHLGEEDGLWRDVHVVPEFLVLQQVLGAVPGVASDGAVDGGADGRPVAGPPVDHQAVEQLVGCPGWELEVGDAVEPSQWLDMLVMKEDIEWGVRTTTTTAPVNKAMKYVHTGMYRKPQASSVMMMRNETRNRAMYHQSGTSSYERMRTFRGSVYWS
jgi:hypothetical protein